MNAARSNQLANAADTLEQWFCDEMRDASNGQASQAYDDWLFYNQCHEIGTLDDDNYECWALTPEVVEAAGVTSAGIDFLGLKDDGYPKSEVYYIPSEDRVCVRLYVNNEIGFATFRGSDRHANSSGCGDVGDDYNLYNE